ncbi:MFS transporter [Metapseudomonas resinovorans]|uniref:Putative major facilitator superfamily transporter n=1 Tax=Metapseudomonas resinovorans NBRC 106553 TaxID=1245471 RepID=S6BIE3_METRE|nr:MFS transporter [Pseudomonas resinovorans]BAN48944.1 putative major facilitator superfamily transporter [Pseudomonas resinovorans NBRC 106553]
MPATTLASRIPRTVWALGFVSLFMDLSSELVHSLLPLFLVGSLGASMLAVGLIEGLAEATAMIVKVFSGAISDYLGKRKGLVLFGYGLAALTKPLFPLAASADQVLFARLLDRVGKGIRGAPRDALVADVAPARIRGACFGLRQAMDSVGAFLGPLLAILLMIALAGDIALVLWFAVLPALLSVGLILFGVQEPAGTQASQRLRSPITWRAWRDFPAAYWWVVGLGALFSLARFSEAFLVLRAQDAGLPATWVPLVMVVMAGVYMLSAYPAGKYADRIAPTRLLAFSLVLLIIADLLLARADSPLPLLLGVAFWGLHMGFSQGILAALVAATTPGHLKGTAFGLFNLASGAALLVASVLAGWLWQSQGAASTFLAGAAFCVAALVLLAVRRRRLN